MNTRQKLTLGIAAIFMVTLTIVGVTYAYFLTRVTGTQDTEVNVGTVEVASLNYVEGDPEVVELKNAVPGEYKTKTFGVNNPNEAVGYFDIVLTNGIPSGATEFLHSEGIADFDNTVCYTENVLDVKEGAEAATLDNCFEGATYDNIEFTLYESNGTTVATDISGNEITGKVNYDATGVGVQNLGTFSVPAGQVRNFVLRVDYVDSETGEKVQNLEFGAALNIKVDIDDPSRQLPAGE